MNLCHRLQLFYDDEYCGDYDEFDLANEIDKLEVFLKMAPEEIESVSTAQIELSTSKKENGDTDENKENDSENKEVWFVEWFYFPEISFFSVFTFFFYYES